MIPLEEEGFLGSGERVRQVPVVPWLFFSFAPRCDL